MKLPRSVTVIGLVMALAAIVVDPSNAPWLTDLLGPAATTKLAAAGAILSALGRAVLGGPPPSEPGPQP